MGSGLTDGDILRMRGVVEDTALPGTAIIYERQRVTDNMGGYTNTYSATGTVEARLDYRRAGFREQTEGAGVPEVAKFVLTIPAGTTVAATGRVEFDSVTYEVLAVMVREPWDLDQRVELAKVD